MKAFDTAIFIMPMLAFVFFGISACTSMFFLIKYWNQEFTRIRGPKLLLIGLSAAIFNYMIYLPSLFIYHFFIKDNNQDTHSGDAVDKTNQHFLQFYNYIVLAFYVCIMGQRLQNFAAFKIAS